MSPVTALDVLFFWAIGTLGGGLLAGIVWLVLIYRDRRKLKPGGSGEAGLERRLPKLNRPPCLDRRIAHRGSASGPSMEIPPLGHHLGGLRGQFAQFRHLLQQRHQRVAGARMAVALDDRAARLVGMRAD